MRAFQDKGRKVGIFPLLFVGYYFVLVISTGQTDAYYRDFTKVNNEIKLGTWAEEEMANNEELDMKRVEIMEGE